jgi:hypothetical protein
MRGYGYWNNCPAKTAAKKEAAPKLAGKLTLSRPGKSCRRPDLSAVLVDDRFWTMPTPRT